MPLDAFTNQLAQLVRGDCVELDAGGAAEFLRPGVGLFGWSCRQIPLLDLFAGDCRSFEVDLSARGVTLELGFDVARGINTGRIAITEMINIRGLILLLDHHRCAVQEAERGVTAR